MDLVDIYWFAAHVSLRCVHILHCSRKIGYKNQWASQEYWWRFTSKQQLFGNAEVLFAPGVFSKLCAETCGLSWMNKICYLLFLFTPSCMCFCPVRPKEIQRLSDFLRSLFADLRWSLISQYQKSLFLQRCSNLRCWSKFANTRGQ